VLYKYLPTERVDVIENLNGPTERPTETPNIMKTENRRIF